MSSESIRKASEYLGSQARLARAVNVSPAMVNQWFRGIRQVAAERCPAIERATGGAVTCEELRPDVDWACLRGTPHEEKVSPAAAAEVKEAA